MEIVVRNGVHGTDWRSWFGLEIVVWNGDHGAEWRSWCELEIMVRIGDHGANAGTIIKVIYNKHLGVFEKH